MGNKFCKVENDYIVNAQKSFANCVTDRSYEDAKAGRNPPREEGVEEKGRCMYYDTNAFSKVDMSKMSDDEKSKIFLDNMVDTGMKCVKKRVQPNVYTVTTSGSVPSNVYRIKSKSSASQQSVGEFEAKYVMTYGAAMAGDSASRAELEKGIDAYFDTSVINGTKASTAQASPIAQASTTSSSPSPRTDYADLEQLFASIVWWLIASVLLVFIFFLLTGLVRSIVGIKKSLSPIQQYAGAKIIKKVK